MTKETAKRDPKEMELHAAQVIEMYFNRGMTQMAIASELKISQPTVSRHISEIRTEWLEKRSTDYQRWLMQKIARSEERYEMALAGWDASCEAKKTQQVTGAKNMPSTATTRTEMRDGDPRFLEQMRKEDELQSKLLGLFTEHVNITSEGRSIFSADTLVQADKQAVRELDDWETARFGKSKPVH